MIRKRNDSAGPRRGAMGIDEKEGMDFTQAYNAYEGNYYQPDYPGNIDVPETNDIKGRKVRNSPGYAAYTSDDDAPLRNVEDFQFTARGGSTQRGAPQWGDDIFDDVMKNDRPGGDDNTDFDTTGPIRAGVNKKQGK